MTVYAEKKGVCVYGLVEIREFWKITQSPELDLLPQATNNDQAVSALLTQVIKLDDTDSFVSDLARQLAKACDVINMAEELRVNLTFDVIRRRGCSVYNCLLIEAVDVGTRVAQHQVAPGTVKAPTLQEESEFYKNHTKSIFSIVDDLVL